MTKTKNLKHAMLMSLLTLVVCLSMLVGSTFAWFTDSVTSVGNKIQAGTLRVDLELLEEDGSWTSIKDSTNAIFNCENWEPGYTDVKVLRVSNEGTLALKWLAKFVSNYELTALADVIDVYVNTTVDSYPTDRSDLSGWTNVGTVREFVNTISATTKGTLEAGKSANLGIALKMQETAGNEYQDMDLGGTFDIQIIATQHTAEEDSFNNQYDLSAAIYVENAAEAQEALDNAKKGDVIVLASGNYGTLLLRPVDGNANTTTSLNEADNEGYTVYRNEYLRTVEDVTILGTTNAKVDAIKVESGYIANSGSSCNLVNVKNLVIDSVEFTDKADCAPHTYSAPIFFNLTWTDVDGLTVKNCKLIGNDDKVNFVYFTIDSSSAFDGVASNVTLTGNTVDGIARLCELRQTENVTITNNTIKNTALHGILLTVHNGVYSGNVTITGNTADSINERFVRMTGAENATVVIKDNVINAYMGADDDYIKVTDSSNVVINTASNVTIENNAMTLGANDADSLAAAIVKGGTVVLTDDIDAGETTFALPAGKTAVIDLNGHTISGVDKTTGAYGLITVNAGASLTINDSFGGGVITASATIDSGWARRSCAVSNERGTVIVNGGTIEHKGGTSMSYAIDNLTNGKNTFAKTVINDGNLKSSYIGIRQFCNGIEAENIVEINGGTITGAKRSVWMQNPNANANTGTLTINGGTFNGAVLVGSEDFVVTIANSYNVVETDAGKILSAK